MNSEEQIRRFFLIGAGFLLILIIGGLVWAILSEPGNGGSNIDPNITFNDDRNQALGPTNAKVTVRIYSDFQCPACKAAEGPLNQIMSEYQDRVRFVWNDLPLTQIHRNASGAAVAARCAGEQGRFWDYAALLFDTQSQWEDLTSTKEHFASLAANLNLNSEQFSACLLDSSVLDLVKKDYQEGVAMGLTGTPTFFINRKIVVGALTEAAWRQELDTALAN